jgi:tetratricopeptide (TPR) repeat protein
MAAGVLLAASLHDPAPENLARGIEAAQRALERVSEPQPRVRLLIGKALRAQGNPRAAIPFLESALLPAVGRSEKTTALLERELGECRQAVHPDLATCASADAALDRAHREEIAFEGEGAEGTTAIEDTPDDQRSPGWRFSLPEPDRYERLILRVPTNRGFVAELNGQEFHRARPVPPKPPSLIPADEEARLTVKEPPLPRAMVFPRERLRPGQNSVALRILDGSFNGKVSLAPVLTAELPLDPARDRKVLEDLRRREGDVPEAAARVAYLEARALQRDGRHADAAERFLEVMAQDASDPLPCLRRAQALLAVGEFEEAERTLRRALDEGLEWGSELWSLWLEVSFGHLNRTPGELLRALPRGRIVRNGDDAGNGESSWREDARWLLERLAHDEPIRINCGGGDLESDGGALWSRDRFYRGGHARRAERRRDFPDTEDDGLYRSERWFPPGSCQPGYRIPLPRGAYRVTLHLVEIYLAEDGHRRFTVSVEGERIPPDGEVEPKADRPEKKAFDTRVDDGVLDVDFVHGTANHPTVSAIEIVPTGGES